MPQRRNRDFVALPEAAVIVYRHIMGREPEPTAASVILCDVAHALANVAPIFCRDGDEMHLRQLGAAELAFGRFHGGGEILRVKDVEYTDLCIRRSDMNTGIALLLGAKVKFALSGLATRRPPPADRATQK